MSLSHRFVILYRKFECMVRQTDGIVLCLWPKKIHFSSLHHLLASHSTTSHHDNIREEKLHHVSDLDLQKIHGVIFCDTGIAISYATSKTLYKYQSTNATQHVCFETIQ